MLHAETVADQRGAYGKQGAKGESNERRQKRDDQDVGNKGQDILRHGGGREGRVHYDFATGNIREKTAEEATDAIGHIKRHQNHQRLGQRHSHVHAITCRQRDHGYASCSNKSEHHP